MIKGEKFRYWVGKSASNALDAVVAFKLTPTSFPIGLHLEFDLQRFLEKPVVQIVDGGANVGNTALRFARFFNQATIHAFEPVARTFKILEERTKHHSNIHCQQLALGENEKSLNISLTGNSELNSLLNENVESSANRTQTVNVVCLDKYFETHNLKGIDLLKLDLEGYELQALFGARSLLGQGLIQAVFAECGFSKTDTYKTTFHDLDEFLTGNGFRFSGFYDTFRWGPNKRWAGFSNGLWLRV